MLKQIIKIKGAKTHNLKNINVNVPKNKLVAITGVSGSGKSSFAFDTLYAEGQRRYIESFSSYVRQFLFKMNKPPVDKIDGLPPAIAINQQTAARNPRSTVGTITETYDWLRILFSRIGKPHCPKCKKPLLKYSLNQIVKKVLSFSRDSRVFVLAPIYSSKKDNNIKKTKQARKKLNKLKKQGFTKVKIAKKIYKITKALDLDFNKLNSFNIEVVIDKFRMQKRDLEQPRILDSIETALRIGENTVNIRVCTDKNYKDLSFTNKLTCPKCGQSFSDIEPRLFSFNNPYGACTKCTGLGVKLEVDPDLVIPNSDLSLAEGAIRPLSTILCKPSQDRQELEKLAKKYKFSLNKPIKKLSKQIIDFILYGKDNFKGVISILEEKYKKTQAEYSRKEIEKYMVRKTCPACKGKRLKPEALAVTIADKNIDQVTNKNIKSCQNWLENLLKERKLSKEDVKIGKLIIKEIIKRLQFLINVNLEYLSLFRSAPSISTGEAQRIRLAVQIGSKLTGILYVLDEPSIGLHPRDQKRLIGALKDLRNLNNTVLVVEHDKQTIKAADWVIDIGPGAGKHGGKIIFQGTPKSLFKSNTLTGKYLSNRLRIDVKNKSKNSKFLKIIGAREHNLKNINVKIPLGVFTCITGVSGSGKSTLINDTLARILAKKLYNSLKTPGSYEKVEGLEYLDKSIIVDQSPIGRTPRSNTATYTNIFEHIRKIFANTKQARARGYGAGRFSFNVKGGRCEECQGAGLKKIEMYYLPDHYIKCPECQGKRYNSNVLEIKYRGMDIYEVLNMTVEEALKFFEDVPIIKEKLSVLKKIGLGYIKLGQPAPSLSGGEAQRIKLATELSRKAIGKTIYILDEPTTGLHPDDIKNLLKILNKLIEKGNTVLVIEHNLDIIRNADWIIDLGPEGGDRGGSIVAEGIPEDIAKIDKSYTGHWLKK